MSNNINSSSIRELEKFISDRLFKKIFIIAGNNSFIQSGLKQFFSNLTHKNISYFFKKEPIPKYYELIQIVKNIETLKPDLIIAAGGGSVIDYAKIANVLDISKNPKEEIITSNYKLLTNSRKLLAIPTTAGSGAEVTANAVIYVDNKKYSIEDKLIKPNYFFLIPDFVKNASNKIKSSAGFDAISQGIESLFSKKSNAESVEHAKNSLKISINYYLKFLKEPNNDNTCAMLFASNLAGKAISISKTTAPHAVSYPFTSFYNISHGHAVSLTLSKFINFNFINQEKADCKFDLSERYKILFDITKTTNINDLELFIEKILVEAKLENNFEKLGININNSIDKILDDVNDQRLLNNPVKVDRAILKSILLKS
jgi:alcohol dehydrogenase class IV